MQGASLCASARQKSKRHARLTVVAEAARLTWLQLPRASSLRVLPHRSPDSLLALHQRRRARDPQACIVTTNSAPGRTSLLPTYSAEVSGEIVTDGVDEVVRGGSAVAHEVSVTTVGSPVTRLGHDRMAAH